MPSQNRLPWSTAREGLMIEWEKRRIKERDETYVDYYSKDGHWWIAEGYDEYARKKEGKPYSLFYRADQDKSKWKSVDTFESIKAAKRSAEEEE